MNVICSIPLRSIVLRFAAVVAITCLVATPAIAQTRFQIPDTFPNYSAYKYADECLTAVLRLDRRATYKDTIWSDTLATEVRAKPRPIAPAAIEHGRSCLRKVNLDTVKVNLKDFDLLARVLLMVGRDDDVKQLVSRMLDSAKTAEDWIQTYGSAANLYSNARPIRIDALKQMLQLSSPFETAKDTDIRRLLMQIQIGLSALTLGDTTLPQQIATAVLDRYSASNAESDALKKHRWLRGQPYPLITDVLLDQAMDSLKVSTHTYRKFLERLWYTFSDAPFSVSRELVGEKAPVISGKYWYRNGWDLDANGQIRTSAQVTTIDPHVVPVAGKVNAIVFLHGGCHSLAAQNASQFVRRVSGGNCWETAALIKRLKRQFPKLEVTVVTKTLGTLGGGFPLTVDEEASAVSNYLLGFFQIPATEVVGETEFVRIPGLDRRRLDIPVGFENDYREIDKGDIVLVDERGEIFHNVTAMPSLGRMELTIRKKLQAVFSRAPQ